MKWNNVKESMPNIIEDSDFSKYCLVTDGESYFIARLYTECYTTAKNYQKGKTSTMWYEEEFGQMNESITHWAELPEIIKEK